MTNYNKYGDKLIMYAESVPYCLDEIQKWKIIFAVLAEEAAPTLEDAKNLMKDRMCDEEYFQKINQHYQK